MADSFGRSAELAGATCLAVFCSSRRGNHSHTSFTPKIWKLRVEAGGIKPRDDSIAAHINLGTWKSYLRDTSVVIGQGTFFWRSLSAQLPAGEGVGKVVVQLSTRAEILGIMNQYIDWVYASSLSSLPPLCPLPSSTLPSSSTPATSMTLMPYCTMTTTRYILLMSV